MKTSLLVVDDFLPNPELVRRRALRSDFQECEFQGAKYKGVGGSNQPEDIHHRISRVFGRTVCMSLMFYRTGTPGNEPTTYIHADRNCAEMAGVLYLNTPDQCRGGTAFWKHKRSGCDSIKDMILSQKFTDFDELNRDGNDEANWEMTGLVPMKFNRFVCYPTDVFHSRYPKEGWGADLENGRLIWVCFFNLR